ncbi:MAG TPA: disulfide bond formation protein DsbA, partial [Chromatiaceae bacterium]|nr:disulfide bond formation protein DsbA [Chromatiaceae bacterium]
MENQQPVVIDYYTDMLCVWAYFGQVKVDELKREFGERIVVNYKFIPLFGCCESRIGQGWEDGGFQGYSRHLLELAKNFPHVQVHRQIWMEQVPASSLPIHLVLKAVQLMEKTGELPGGRTSFETLMWNLRLGFFRDGQNIADKRVLHAHLEALQIPVEAMEAHIADGTAFAEMALDIEEQKNRMVEGSPTFLMNE